LYSAESDGAWPGAPEAKIRIVLVDSHAILRDGLRALLDFESDLEVVGSTGGGPTALNAVRELQPQLVIADVEFPDCPGISVISGLLELDPAPRVLVLTARDAEADIRAALNAGIHGYVLKDSSRVDLLRAIRAVVGGRQYLCPAVAAKVVSGFVTGFGPKQPARSEVLMTGREREVLTRIALGQSNKQIARDLGLSVKTVEKHRANLMRKLTLHNAAAVTLFALRHGFIQADATQSRQQPGDASLLPA
jgi:two-component system, NarL family, response regulator NreC